MDSFAEWNSDLPQSRYPQPDWTSDGGGTEQPCEFNSGSRRPEGVQYVDDSCGASDEANRQSTLRPEFEHQSRLDDSEDHPYEQTQSVNNQYYFDNALAHDPQSNWPHQDESTSQNTCHIQTGEPPYSSFQHQYYYSQNGQSHGLPMGSDETYNDHDMPAYPTLLSRGVNDAWSTENQHEDRISGMMTHIDPSTIMVVTLGVSPTSDANDLWHLDNPYPQTLDLNDVNEDGDWGQNSETTVRGYPGYFGPPIGDVYGGHVGVIAIAEPPIPTQQGPSAQASQIRFEYQPSLPAELSHNPPNNHDLLGQPSQAQNMDPSSSSNSTISEVVHCQMCDAEFTGVYRRGNHGRHYRNKHKDDRRAYVCEDDHCDRAFARSDARLKHYRKHHPYLVSGPAVPRKQRSSRLGVDIEPFEMFQEGSSQSQNSQGT